jgi:hypothetical protein
MKIFENNDYYTFANGIEKFANAIKSSWIISWNLKIGLW